MAKTITLHGHNYTVISPNTQFARRIKRQFDYSSDVTLDDVYGSYSYAKARAYEYCRAREHEFSSYDGVITGHNSMTFSYAFTGWCEGKLYLIYITKCHDYALEIEAR